MLDKRQFYIGGAWVTPLAGTDMDVIDPFDRRGLRRYHAGWASRYRCRRGRRESPPCPAGMHCRARHTAGSGSSVSLQLYKRPCRGACSSHEP